MVNSQKISQGVKSAIMGIVQGNLPEILGASGAYITFKDKPYALAVAIDQVKGTALTSSIVGAVVALVQEYFLHPTANNGGNGGNRKRRRNRKRNR